MIKLRLIYGLCSLLFVSLIFTSCDEDDTENDELVASFQATVDEDNFFLVQFDNYSQNATSYEWDFGDGSTSTDMSPMHEYSEGSTFTVVLTAHNDAGESIEFSNDITITDPDKNFTLLVGSTSKTWKLLREGAALGIGPDAASWWSWWNLSNDGSRNCLFDDEFIFHRSGTFEYQANGSFWGEADYYAASDKESLNETCFDETDENLIVDGVDYSTWLSSDTHSFTYDATSGSIALTGEGAWMGLYKLGTAGYNAKGDTPPAATSFSAIIAEGLESGVDTLTVGFQYEGQYWNAIYVSYADEMDEPGMGVPEPAPGFSFIGDGLTVTFTNTSSRAESYSWDFGDGNTSTDVDPVHTYAAEGTYTVTLSATGNDITNATSQEVIVSSAEFSAEVLSSADGKIWKLAGEASYKVGPTPGSGEWWGGLDAAGVTDRACQMDDEYVFTDGGAYAMALQASTWAEGYMGGSDACVDPSTLAAPFNAFGAGSDYTFTVTEASGDTPAMITVNGTGSYIGWSKPNNTGEYDGTQTELASTLTYQVHDYVKDGSKEVLTLAIDYSDGAGTGFWTVTIMSE